ncbi:antitoxin Xre/MbcA/ParS toxin-binding domain-containing protein [Pseudomonas fluorescens]|uniref:antitoxin Xre/MbcA/ParS toxin-binding domain-containing protein n=1 Tax=Pseudomonas fluorescens TaxID=294 RepID=UPI003D03B769
MFAEVMREDAYHSYRIRLERLLGIPCNACDQDIHELIEAGFPPDRIQKLCDLSVISRAERNQIIASRTLKARVARNQRLTLHESDQLFRLVHVTAMAEVLFGDEIKAKRWLSKSKDRFAGRRPLEMLSTLPGTREVEVMLIQLAEPFAF